MSKDIKRQIIILRTEDSYHGGCYECGGAHKVIESVTDWDEVTQDEFNILMQMSSTHGFQILERNPLQTLPSKALLRTPRDYIAKWHDDQKELERRREEQRQKRAAQKKESDAKALERKRKQLEKLKVELGEK